MNKLKERYNLLIENSVANYLLDLGYTRKGNYFYYLANEMQYSYEIAIEKFKKTHIQFYILAGVNHINIDRKVGRKIKKHPKRYDNLYNKTIFEIANKQLHKDYIIDVNTDIKLLQTQIFEHLHLAENKLNEIQTESDLIDLCILKNKLVHHDDLFRYLAITKDEKRIALYLPTIKQRLYFIADRAYNSYIEKLNQYKKEFE